MRSHLTCLVLDLESGIGLEVRENSSCMYFTRIPVDDISRDSCEWIRLPGTENTAYQ